MSCTRIFIDNVSLDEFFLTESFKYNNVKDILLILTFSYSLY